MPQGPQGLLFASGSCQGATGDPIGVTKVNQVSVSGPREIRSAVDKNVIFSMQIMCLCTSFNVGILQFEEEEIKTPLDGDR